ncbi:AI-2E family transporter [Sphingomonas sp. MMS24-J13]|uniref:AI-2E family transporter n=1 Tax=Sphingomonas sp. MMS24-J13 TaxID=3238686 RepID=UPI00384D4E6C
MSGGLLRSAIAGRAAEALRRDRLLAAIALFAGIGVMIALPFALRAGAGFFLPVTAALVIAIALVPMLEWFERRRVPSPLAAFLCISAFLAVANAAVVAIIVPATGWFALLPERVVRIRHNLRPLLDLYSSLDQFVSDTSATFMRGASHGRAPVAAAPNSLLDVVASSAPVAILQMFFAVLVVYFFLSGWTRMRRRTITSRGSFSSALTTARVIQEMVDATSAYLATITLINVCLGALVAFALWLIGLPDPLMWGGIVTLFNYMPYLGPIAAALLLSLGGLMVFKDAWYAAFPPLVFVGAHLIESNVITPALVGRRLTINPLLILISLSFWGWVWGATGALLAVPLLIIVKTVLDAAGTPDIAGFLFEEGTLTSPLPEVMPPPPDGG